MASSSESGHAINVANMKRLISYAIEFKEEYNPSRESLKIASLQEISLNGENVIDKVHEMFAAYKIAVGARKTAFAPLSQLVTKVINSLRATETLDHTDRSATTFVRKIQGRRAKPKRTEEEREADAAAGKDFVEISASQMSYNCRLGNFASLIEYLSGEKLYKPNEIDLKVSSLKALHEDLERKNAAVLKASTLLKFARVSRDEILYKENSGLVDIAQDVKIYIKSVYGASSSHYKKISKIEFAKIRP